MGKSRKPATTRKPPEPSESHAEIEQWTRSVMPDLHPIVKQVDETVREASLHYNLRTTDGASDGTTALENNGSEPRTVYGREDCLQGLRSRCRRLRATGALERDWKVAPTAEDSVTSSL